MYVYMPLNTNVPCSCLWSDWEVDKYVAIISGFFPKKKLIDSHAWKYYFCFSMVANETQLMM